MRDIDVPTLYRSRVRGKVKAHLGWRFEAGVSVSRSLPPIAGPCAPRCLPYLEHIALASPVKVRIRGRVRDRVRGWGKGQGEGQDEHSIG